MGNEGEKEDIFVCTERIRKVMSYKLHQSCCPSSCGNSNCQPNVHSDRDNECGEGSTGDKPGVVQFSEYISGFLDEASPWSSTLWALPERG